MDIYIYNSSAMLLGITDVIASLKWTKRFFRGDDFTAVFPATEHNLSLIAKKHIIEVPNRYCGFITSLRITTKNSSEVIIAKGVSIDGMLSRRIIAYGNTSDSLMELLDKNAGAASAYLHRAFENTVFDTDVSCEGMLSDILRYKSADRYVEIVGKAKGFGVKAEIVHSEDSIYNHIRFYGRYAADRSVNQSENTPVIFADIYDSISECGYFYSEAGEVNSIVLYSDPKSDYAENIAIPAYVGCTVPDSNTGYGVIERAVKTEPKIKYNIVTSGEKITYIPVLDTAAMEAEADEYVHSNTAPPTDRMSGVLKISEDYTERFDVGDIVTFCCKRWGIVKHERICEITEVYDADGISITAVTGGK